MTRIVSMPLQGPRFAAAAAACLPLAARELAGWERLAAGIPDGQRRLQALSSLRHKAFHSLGAAVFGALVPQPLRRPFVRFAVALQSISDYLDSLCDRAGLPSIQALRLHRALEAAVGANPLRPASDGYLEALVHAARTGLAPLPAYGCVAEANRRLARLYGQMQARKHGEPGGRRRHMVRWFERQGGLQPGGGPGLPVWWEFAAACGSTLAVFALTACAARPHLTAEAAGRVLAAYFPWVCAVHILLDYLIDRTEDAGARELNFAACYGRPERACARIEALYRAALAAVSALPQAPFHRLVLAGLPAVYLTDPKAADLAPFARRLKALDPYLKAVWPGVALWRRLTPPAPPQPAPLSRRPALHLQGGQAAGAEPPLHFAPPRQQGGSGLGAPGQRQPTSSRIEAITPFMAMDVLERAQALEALGRRVWHLEVGQPDFPTLPPALEAARQAMARGHTRYTHSLGIPPLREAIAAYYRRRYGVEVDAERVVVTAGTSPAMGMLALALLEGGDEAVVPDPGYSCYANYVQAAGGVVVRADASARRGGHLTARAVQEVLTPRTRLMLVNSPANPTGAVIPPGELAALGRLADRHGLWLVSDEIYHGLVYEGQEATALTCSERAVVVDGFSKRYAMTGWRLGWCVVPPELVRAMQKLQQNLMVCPPSVSQWAGLKALEAGEPYVRQMAAAYDERRRWLLAALPEAGLELAVRPAGAFYAWVDARPYGSDSLQLAFDVLEQTGVALTPGIDFGPGGEGHLRISYASSLETLQEALGRLKPYLAERARAAGSGASGGRR